MSEIFTASNRVRVNVDGERVDVVAPVGADPFEPVEGAVTALREFFQHERDQELGRWRWPEYPEYVVYPSAFDENEVVVLSEEGAATEHVWRGQERPGSYLHDAARAYFAAHPEPKPLPSEPHTAWVDKYGTDIWWVDGLGKLRCCASPSSDPAKYAPFTRLVPEVSDVA